MSPSGASNVMAWLWVIGGGVACGLLGAVLALMAGPLIIRAYNISNFEGQSGYFVVFIVMPLGFFAGLLTGAVVMRMSGANSFGAALLHGLVALLSTAGVVTIGVAIAWLARPTTLLVDGRVPVLELELRIRPDEYAPDNLPPEDLRLGVYSGKNDNVYAQLLPDRTKLDGEWMIVPAESPLSARYSRRVVGFGIGNAAGEGLELPLAAKPSARDSTWSAWLKPLRRPNDAENAPKTWEVRYRVRFDEP